MPATLTERLPASTCVKPVLLGTAPAGTHVNSLSMAACSMALSEAVPLLRSFPNFSSSNWRHALAAAWSCWLLRAVSSTGNRRASMVCMYLSRTLHGVLQACFKVPVLVAHPVIACQHPCAESATEPFVASAAVDVHGLHLQFSTEFLGPIAKRNCSTLPTWTTERRYNLAAPSSCPAVMCRFHSSAWCQ